MAQEHTFDVLILIARPAAGKSEIIDYLRSTRIDERGKRFFIRDFESLDDFPLLWSWFEEDGILEGMGKPRLHTSPDGYFSETYFWDVLIRHLSLEYDKRLKSGPSYHDGRTVIVEFSRGSEHGGYARAFQHLSRVLLSRAAVLYVAVSFEESCRKNLRRFNRDRPGSILEHSVPEEKMRRLYGEVDWESFSAPDPGYLHVQGLKVPYRVFPNEDDVTTGRGDALGVRLEECLGDLWSLYRNSR